VNANEGEKQAWCLQVKLCDPCLSALRTRCLSSKALYKSTYLYLYLFPNALRYSMGHIPHSVSHPHSVAQSAAGSENAI